MTTANTIQQFLISQDRNSSKKIVIKGDRNVLTTAGTCKAEDFTSIVGQNIEINGEGNIVSGEKLTLEGSQMMIFGQGLTCKGSHVIIVASNKMFSGQKKMLLDRFLVDLDQLDNYDKDNYLFYSG